MDLAVGGPSSEVLCALIKSGKVMCWGDIQDTIGIFGNGAVGAQPGPAAVQGIDDAMQLAMSENHACVVRKSGKVACWGSNLYDAVGAAAPPMAFTPVDVPMK